MADNTKQEENKEVFNQQEETKQEGIQEGDKSDDGSNSVIRKLRKQVKDAKETQKELEELKKFKEEVENRKLEEEGKVQELLEKEKEKRLQIETELKKVKTDRQLNEALSDIPNPQVRKLVQSYAKDLLQTDEGGNITNLDDVKASIESEFNTVIKPTSPITKNTSGQSNITQMTFEQIKAIPLEKRPKDWVRQILGE